MLRICGVVAALVLCAASATPYQASGLRGGYSERHIAPDTWAVHADVNGYTSRGTAMEYAYRRAGELCPSGFDVVDGETSSDVSVHRNAFDNGAHVVEKPEVTLIARCRRTQPATRPPVVALQSNAEQRWFCTTSLEVAVGDCQRHRLNCESTRDAMVAQGYRLGDCIEQAAAFCFDVRTAQGLVAESCSPTSSMCTASHGMSLGTVLSSCEQR